MGSKPLADFFTNNGVDGAGRTLLQIVGKTDGWLESNHDFIQWLFPLAVKSGANPDAPLIDDNLLALFRGNARARDNMLLAFDRMLKFYGLQRNGATIARGDNWDGRKDNWFTHPTHNNLRITRMLKSMTLLSLETYAQSFLDTLVQLSAEPGCGFSEEALGFWKAATR